MSLLGLNNSFIQGFDHKKSNLSNLKKLSTRFMTSGSNFLHSKFQPHFDPEILEAFQDYISEYNTPDKNFDMGTKLSQINYCAPKVHYEMKKPAVNIIGGYVGAKSSQNRESNSICIIHDIVMQLLPELLSEPQRNCDEMTASFLDMQAQAEEYFGRTVISRDKEEIHLTTEATTHDSSEKNPQKCVENDITLSSMPTVQSCSVYALPTYASVVSAPPPVMPPVIQERCPDRRSKNSPSSKSAKNRRKKKRRRQKKQNQIERSGASSSYKDNQVNDCSFLIDEIEFPSLCEGNAASANTTTENEISDIRNIIEVNYGINPYSLPHDDFLCGVDEVDSPHSSAFSSYRNDDGMSPGSTVTCHNNTIAFIINGNDELSDTDSDWSCDAIDTFKDDVWDTFKQNFECFQNLFAVDRICANERIPEEDNDCVLQDDELLLYINHVDMNSDSPYIDSEEVVAARLKDVNDKWNCAMKDVVVSEKQNSKVCFAPENQLVKVYHLDGSLEEIRSESWEHYHLDRCRFRNRIQTLEPLLSWCFDVAHRQKVWDRLHSIL